jgi:methionyl-tRNA formyltransferase
MKLIFFGTSEFAVPTLRALAPHIVLVVSQPDRPSGRGAILQATPVKLASLELGLAVLTPEKSRAPDFVEHLESIAADALVVAAYGQILSQRVLDSAVRGGINLHGSILPKYRGAAPIQRAIQAGETETGITLMQMDRGMDTGDAIAVETLAIHPDETYGELQFRLAALAAEMAKAWMPRIVAGNYPRTPQNNEDATIAPKVEKLEAMLSFDQFAEVAYRNFRAFTPSPGASLMTAFGRLRLSELRLATGTGEPGTVLSIADGCEIAFLGGSLILKSVQLEGKKRMSGRDFANGMRLQVGASIRPQ